MMKVFHSLAGFVLGLSLVSSISARAENVDAPPTTTFTTFEDRVEKFTAVLPDDFSDQEKKWLIDWLGKGLMEPFTVAGFPHHPMRSILMRYKSGCPESQMRYLIKRLLELPNSNFTDEEKAGLLLTLSSCKDQSVIDLTRSILKEYLENKNLTIGMVYAAGEMNDPEINKELLAYLNDKNNPFNVRLVTFQELVRQTVRSNRVSGEQLLEQLKQIVAADMELQKKANNEFYTSDPEIPFQEVSLELMYRACMSSPEEKQKDLEGLLALKIVGDNATEQVNLAGSNISQFVFIDKRYKNTDKDPTYSESYFRYIILKTLAEADYPPDKYPQSDIEYVQEEYAKLAPKYADKAKKLADAEAAYIAQYPDRAPQPIEK